MTPRPLLLQGQMFSSSTYSWEKEVPDNPEQQRLHQEQAQHAAGVMRRVKSPWADCPEAATAYMTASTVDAAGTDAFSEHIELGEGVLDNSQSSSGYNRSKLSKQNA